MDGIPATANIPIQIPLRRGRLFLLVGGFVLLIAALWGWLVASVRAAPAPGNPFIDWRVAIPFVTVAGLLLLAVVTALADLRQRGRWVLGFCVIFAEALLLTAEQLIIGEDYR